MATIGIILICVGFIVGLSFLPRTIKETIDITREVLS